MKNKIIVIQIITATMIFCTANAAESPKDSTLPTAIATSAGYMHSKMKPYFSVSEQKGPVSSKKFFFSIVLTPDFKNTTVPPVSLYFERGIAQFLSLGANIGGTYYHDKYGDAATVGIGLRACGYAIPAVAAFGSKLVNSYGFDPFIGLTYNYYITAISDLDNTLTGSNFGIVVGTRWYPGNKRGFGILAEYGTTGITGANLRFGITLGR